MNMIQIDSNEWEEEMHMGCTCGHMLYQHAFTMSRGRTIEEYSSVVTLNTSQCIMCGYDQENEKFMCEEFNYL